MSKFGRVRPFALQRKVTATLIAILFALVALSYLVLNATVAPAFDRLERSIAGTNLIRAQRAIESDLANLASIAGDWAPWDEAHSFVRGQNPGFYDQNLNDRTSENLGVNFLMFFDAAGNAVGRVVHQDGQLVDSSRLDFFNPSNPDYSPLFVHDSTDDHSEGLIQTELGPSLIAVRPIVMSNREGPIAGTVVIGRFLDDGRRQRLQERTEISLTWTMIDDVTRGPMPDELIASGTQYMHHVAGDDAIRSYRLLDDVFGEPLLVLQTETPRQISTLGGSTVGATLLLISAVGMVLAAVSWWLLRTSIATPLERIARHISRIRESGDLSVRLNARRADEIGMLAGEFDMMAGELQDARRLLLQQSFNAGKADTAAALLHNVRNAMTPLVNGIESLGRNFSFVRAMRVPRAIEQLRTGDCTQERRDGLLQYLETAFDHIRTTSDTAVAELQVASRQARQVDLILHEQEKFAVSSPVMEEFGLVEVVDEAALVVPADDTPEVVVRLRPNLALFRVRGHRIALLQVLGNLIFNAYEAIKQHSADAGEIDIAASADYDDGPPMVHVTVRDTGCGFDADVANRVFQRGYTSKSGSFTGLGLHWSANAVAGMGGRMYAESPGRGSGAVFHLLVPLADVGSNA